MFWFWICSIFYVKYTFNAGTATYTMWQKVCGHLSKWLSSGVQWRELLMWRHTKTLYWQLCISHLMATVWGKPFSFPAFTKPGKWFDEFGLEELEWLAPQPYWTPFLWDELKCPLQTNVSSWPQKYTTLKNHVKTLRKIVKLFCEALKGERINTFYEWSNIAYRCDGYAPAHFWPYSVALSVLFKKNKRPCVLLD